MSNSSIPLFKRCTKCGQELPNTPDYFYARGKNGKLRDDCKTCRQKQDRAHYEANKEKIIARSIEYIREHPEKRKEWQKTYADRNPEKTREKGRRSEEKHRAERNQRNRDKYATNLEDRKRVAAKSCNRRARKAAAEGSHNLKDIQAQYDKQNGLCFWCSEPVGENFHVDHIIPLVRDGSNDPSNLVIACPTCNVRKSWKLPYTEWQPPKPLNLD